jgi:O-antigen/teichoic acid export membrane protein
LYLNEAQMVAWWAFLSLGALATLADFGFSPAVTRAYSIFWAGSPTYTRKGIHRVDGAEGTPNLPGLARLHGTVRRLYAYISILLFAMMAAGGTAYLLTGPLKEASSAEWSAWGMYVAVACYNLRMSYWEQAATGINQVRLVQISNMAGGIVYVLCGCLLLWAGAGLLSMAAANGLRVLVARAICRHACLKQLGPLPVQKVDAALFGEILPNAARFGMMSVGGYLLNHGVVLIGLQYLNPGDGQALGLTQQLSRFAVNIACLLLQVKWPQLTMMRTQNQLDRMSRIFARRFFYTMASLFCMYAVLYGLGDTLLSLLGSDKRLLPSGPLLLYLIYVFWQNGYVMFGLLVFTDNQTPFHWVALSTGLAGMVFCLLLTPRFGLWGLLAAPFIAESLFSCWYTLWLGFKCQTLSVRQFLREMFRSPLHG